MWGLLVIECNHISPKFDLLQLRRYAYEFLIQVSVVQISKKVKWHLN